MAVVKRYPRYHVHKYMTRLMKRRLPLIMALVRRQSLLLLNKVAIKVITIVYTPNIYIYNVPYV